MKKRPDGEESVESVEGNYVDVSKYSPPDISQYTSHEVEELLLSKVRRDYSVPVPGTSRKSAGNSYFIQEAELF